MKLRPRPEDGGGEAEEEACDTKDCEVEDLAGGVERRGDKHADNVGQEGVPGVEAKRVDLQGDLEDERTGNSIALWEP